MANETAAVATEEAKPRKSVGCIITAIVRVLLGLAFVAFVLMGLLMKQEPPPDMSETAKTYIGGLMAAKFIMPIVTGVMALVGVMLLTNRFVPLGLALITPILVAIVGTHIFVMPQNWQPGVIMLV